MTITRKFRIEVEDNASIEASIKLDSIPIDLKLGAKVSHNCSLEVESEFPPGVLYRAYTRFPAGPLQTEMWATEGRN